MMRSICWACKRYVAQLVSGVKKPVLSLWNTAKKYRMMTSILTRGAKLLKNLPVSTLKSWFRATLKSNTWIIVRLTKAVKIQWLVVKGIRKAASKI